MGAYGGHQNPSGRAHKRGGRSLPIERQRRTEAPSGPGLPARGMGSPAQEPVTASGAVWGDGIPNDAAPSWGGRGVLPGGNRCLWSACGRQQPPADQADQLGDGVYCRGGSRCLWSSCRGQQPPSARAHHVVGRGVLPKRQSLPMERLQWTEDPIGAG